MPDHKFEPFQRVLVRNGGKWVAAHFSHMEEMSAFKVCCTGGVSYAEIIPYTEETAHLLGTTQPYEPPTPPQEYEWGQKVEVSVNGVFEHALYDSRTSVGLHVVLPRGGTGIKHVCETDIRPLPDSAAQ